MSDFEAQIREAASRNADLLRVLAETDYSIPALEEQQRFISDLDTELSKNTKRIRDLDIKRKKELKDHEKYRDSHVRRFVYKATGKKEKFAQQAEKEEREYFEVLQEEHQVKELKRNLEEQLEAAQKVKRELEETTQRHNNAQQELDHLYHSIFSGPTPQFPEEDAKEKQSDQMLQVYHDVRMRAEKHAHVVQLLSNAVKPLQRSLMHIQSALTHSRIDMFGGGSINDFMERQQLTQAQGMIQQAQMLVQQARQADPQIPEFPPIRINHGSILTDVFFDNIFTDMAFHDEIKRGQFEVQRFGATLKQQLDAAQGRKAGVEQELRSKEEDLERARKELQREREKAFERYASQQTASDPPPAYDAPSAAPK